MVDDRASNNNVVEFPLNNNVIEFPLKNKNRVDSLSAAAGVMLVKLNHIDETLGMILPQLFNNIELAGFNIIPEYENESNQYVKDVALIIESIKSLLAKYYQLRHPFQELSENVFCFDDDSLRIVDNINLDLNVETEAS